eukprot:COSAG06_NODE_456_length_15511_cov_7.299312_12_plen_81_part_00
MMRPSTAKPSVTAEGVYRRDGGKDRQQRCLRVSYLSTGGRPARSAALSIGETPAKPAGNGFFEPFIHRNDHFAKTGSGQT